MINLIFLACFKSAFLPFLIIFVSYSGDYSNALLHYEKGVTKLPEVSFMTLFITSLGWTGIPWGEGGEGGK